MASRAALEALLARVQRRASEPRPPSVAVMARDVMARDVMARDVMARDAAPPEVAPVDDLDDDIEEYDDELIEIIDDAEVIPQAAAVARAIEPSAFGAAVERGPAAAVRHEPAAAPPAPARSLAPASERLQAEAVAPRPIAATEVASARGTRRELRSTSFSELLDASLRLG